MNYNQIVKRLRKLKKETRKEFNERVLQEWNDGGTENQALVENDYNTFYQLALTRKMVEKTSLETALKQYRKITKENRQAYAKIKKALPGLHDKKEEQIKRFNNMTLDQLKEIQDLSQKLAGLCTV